MAAMRQIDRARARAAKMRLVGSVIALTALVWLGAQWLGGKLGWEARYVFLFDFAAIAALVWSLVVTFQIWRESRG